MAGRLLAEVVALGGLREEPRTEVPGGIDQPTSLREQQLIARIQAGDHAAYAALVRPHEGLALRMSFLVTHNVEDAEDAVQEALVKTYLSLHRFRLGAPFRPWLLRIVMNEAIDKSRSTRRRTNRPLQAAAEATEQQSAETQILNAERLRELVAALHGLREEERLVVVCRALLGLSEEETAGILDTPIGTTKSRFARGRANLRRLLGTIDA